MQVVASFAEDHAWWAQKWSERAKARSGAQKWSERANARSGAPAASKINVAEHRAASFVISSSSDASLLCVLDGGDCGWSRGSLAVKSHFRSMIMKAWATSTGDALSRLGLFEKISIDLCDWIKATTPDWEQLTGDGLEEIAGTPWAIFAAAIIVGDTAAAGWIGPEVVQLRRNGGKIAATLPHSLYQDYKTASGKSDAEMGDFPHPHVWIRRISPPQPTNMSTQSLGHVARGDVIAILDWNCEKYLAAAGTQDATTSVTMARTNGADSARALVATIY